MVILRKGVKFNDQAGLMTYLRKTAYYLFLEERRKMAKKPTFSFEEFDGLWQEQPSEESEHPYLAALRQCLKEISTKALTALKLFYAERYSRQQLSEALDMTEDGIRNLMQRSRKKLEVCVRRKVHPEEQTLLQTKAKK